MSCTCSNAGAGSCNCNPRAANAGSSLTVSASCLTAGSNAELVAILHLVDGSGTPAKGATVTFTSSSAAATWVEAAAVELANPPGTYYRTLKAAPSMGSTTIHAAVAYCGASTPITAAPSVSFASPAPATGYAGAVFQGVGGCTPIGGHLRVKVIAAETGAPIMGASVLVGASAGTPYVGAAASLFPTPSPSGANTGTTDANGIVELNDFGGALAGPQLVTAGAQNRAYATYYHWNGDDQVIALPLRRPTKNTYRYTNGTVGPDQTPDDCTWVEAAFVLQDTTMSKLARFDITSLVGPNKCISAGILGTKALPENIYAPSQTIGTSTFLCIVGLSQSPWSLSVDEGARIFSAPAVELPASVVQGGVLVDMIKAAKYQAIGYQSTTASAATSGDGVTVHASYQNSVTYNFANVPANTDVTGLALVDYSGSNGTGAIGLNGVQVHKYSDSGTTVAVPVGDTTGAPAGTQYLGEVVASFLTPIAPRTINNDLLNAGTSSFVRGTGGSQPFDSTKSTSVSVSNFLGLAPSAVGSAGTVFTFGDASNGAQAPQYSVSTLTVRHSTWLPQQSCQMAPSHQTLDYPQWIVVRPHAADGTACASLSTAPASCEGFTLPTLPSSFPQAGSGTQQQSGFEQFVGSGAACSGTCALAGESCRAPAGTTMPTECMGNDGTNNFTESYTWVLEDRVLGLAPGAIAAGAADLTQSIPGLTQSSTNAVAWP
jgi:hypothetical protein